MAYEQLISADGTIDDTLSTLVDTINEESKSKFCIDAARLLGPTTPLPDFLRRVYDYVQANVRYQLDGNTTDGKEFKEEIWTPAKIVAVGRGDCKKMATLIGCILKAAGIEPILKHVEMPSVHGEENDYTHIYVIVPNPDLSNYIVLDTTPETDMDGNIVRPAMFNEECKYQDGQLYFLNQQAMEVWKMGAKRTGANNSDPVFMDSLTTASGQLIDNMQMGGVFQHLLHPKVAEMLKKGLPHHLAVQNVLAEKFGHYKNAPKVANIPFEQQRGALLQLIDHNYQGIATHLANAMAIKPDVLDEVWHIMGGDILGIKNAIIAAAKKEPAMEEGESNISPSHKNVSGLFKKGFFKKILHGAAQVLHFVAPIANAIIPGAGGVLNGIANKADKAAEILPTPPAAAPAPPVADIPKDPGGHHASPVTSSGSLLSHPVTTFCKTCLVISVSCTNFHLSAHTSALLGTLTIVMFFPIFYTYKFLTNGRI